MPRYFFTLDGVKFERMWQFGTVRFLPADQIREELDQILGSKPESPSFQDALSATQKIIDDWAESATVEVRAVDDASAHNMAAHALSILRFFMRSRIGVNPEIHLIGFEGDIPEGIRHYITAWEDDPIVCAPGWRRIGGRVDFTFTSQIIDSFEEDPALSWLGDQVSLPPIGRSPAGRRALTAIDMHDAGLRALNDNLRILCSAIAVETLFARADCGKESQTTAIARRIAYLTCQGGCGRIQDLCPYTTAGKTKRSLLKDLQRIAQDGGEWRCSAFLDISAPDDEELLENLSRMPLFYARNSVAHKGAHETDDLAHHIWVADQALHAGLKWLGENPGLDIADLDGAIGGEVPAG